MRFQLLLLGAVAALTLGAVSLTGTAPAGSLSAVPSPLVTPSAEASQSPEAAALAGAATIAETTTAIRTDTTTTQPEVAPAAARPATSTPAGCTAPIQFVPAARGGRGPAVASAIADCVDQLPIGVAIKKNLGPGGGGPGG